MKKHQLIISLIKDHLIHIRLVDGLETLGLDPFHYSLHLGGTIFQLMNLGDDDWSDQVYKYYMQLQRKVHKINIAQEPEKLHDLADSIYFRLSVKKLEKIKKPSRPG